MKKEKRTQFRGFYFSDFQKRNFFAVFIFAKVPKNREIAKISAFKVFIAMYIYIYIYNVRQQTIYVRA